MLYFKILLNTWLYRNISNTLWRIMIWVFLIDCYLSQYYSFFIAVWFACCHTYLSTWGIMRWAKIWIYCASILYRVSCPVSWVPTRKTICLTYQQAIGKNNSQYEPMCYVVVCLHCYETSWLATIWWQSTIELDGKLYTDTEIRMILNKTIFIHALIITGYSVHNCLFSIIWPLLPFLKGKEKTDAK